VITAWTGITIICFVGYLIGIGYLIRDLIRCSWNFQTYFTVALFSIISILWVEVGFEMGKYFASA